jgi:hypothetical protein
MNSMAIDRRSLLLGAALTLCARSRAVAGVDAGEAVGDAALVSACRRADGAYALVLLSLDGRIVREIALSDRGHDIAVDRGRGLAVAFSRRPGTFAVAFSTAAGGDGPVVFAAAGERTFSGHGVFAHDGRLLYATENDDSTGAGLIGIYDTATWRRLGEMGTHGIDPHEAILLGDGRTLAVANGGIEMSGREKLNIAAMQPSLVFLDVASGEMKALHRLPAQLNQLSIRHIAADASGQVWFGGQWEGAMLEAPELVGRAGVDRPLRLIEAAQPMGAALKGYVGSVAISQDGRVLAAAAPRAGRTIFIDTAQGTVTAEMALPDGCGVAGLHGGMFALSSGHGDLIRDEPGQPPEFRTVLTGTAFDNHLRVVR